MPGRVADAIEEIARPNRDDQREKPQIQADPALRRPRLIRNTPIAVVAVIVVACAVAAGWAGCSALDGGYNCRHHADGQLSSNRQGGSPRHRREAEGRAAGPTRCHRAGNDDHRNQRYRGVPDQSRSPQGRIRLDLRLFLLVVAVWTGDLLDGISNPSRHDHTVSLPPRRSRTKSARLRTGLPRWSSVKRHDHRRTGSIP